MRRPFWPFLILAVILAGCADRLGQPYRIKVTLEAEVMGQPRRVEQVYEIQHWLCKQAFCSARRLSGDALAFDLGGNASLVSPLDGKIQTLLFSILAARRDGDRYPRDIFPMNTNDIALINNGTGVHAFEPWLLYAHWILLTDRNDPTTARYLDVYGENARRVAPIIRLTKATVEKTSASVTRGITRLLPWVDRYTQGAPFAVLPHDLIKSEHPHVIVKAHLTETRD
jgi:hypothetical protein